MTKTFRVLNFCHLNLLWISDFRFRIFHYDDGQKGRFPTGFTLVEAVISLIIVATMFVAALNTVGTSRLSQHKCSLGSRGRLFAESLMTEILRLDYLDPDREMEIDLYRDDGLIHVITTSASYIDDVLWASTYFGLSRYDG